MSEYRSTLADKFWLRMGEKFGKRWIDERGPQPNDEWRALLNRYTEYQVNLALDDLPKWAHPPTHPEIASHLRSFATKSHERAAADWARDYWRSYIVNELEHWGWIRGYWKKGTSILVLDEPQRSRLLAALRRLLDEAVDADVQLGQRPPGLTRKISNDCERVIATLRAPLADPTADRHP